MPLIDLRSSCDIALSMILGSKRVSANSRSRDHLESIANLSTTKLTSMYSVHFHKRDAEYYGRNYPL